jgi:tetratricopeptide (TPR) repeat protein
MEINLQDLNDEIAEKDDVEEAFNDEDEPEKLNEKVEAQKTEQDNKGKDEYNKGNYEEAIKAWTLSLKSVKYMLDKGCYKDKPDQLAEVYQIQCRLNLNMAQGSLKIRDWRNAIEYADKVLEYDANSIKALYRKAEALIGLGDLKLAISILDILLKIEPENAAAKQLKAKTQRSLAESDRRASKAAKKMFASLEKDPRIPATGLEQLTEQVRNAPLEAKRYVSELLESAWEALMDAIYAAKNTALRPFRWLRSLVSSKKSRSKAD